jgi:hypothetical protein
LGARSLATAVISTHKMTESSVSPCFLSGEQPGYAMQIGNPA